MLIPPTAVESVSEYSLMSHRALGTEVAFPDIMRFNGAGPEVINSRLAMVRILSRLANCDHLEWFVKSID